MGSVRHCPFIFITDITKTMDDNLDRQIQDIINQTKAASTQDDKTQKVARLVVLLVKIEKELKTVNQTLHKLLEHQLKHNPNSHLLPEIEQKLQTVERLTIKIQKARLNLNYHFI